MAISYAISALPALSAYAGGDLLAIVDISDFTEAPTGTTKKITVADLFTNVSVTGTLGVAGVLTLSNRLVGLSAVTTGSGAGDFLLGNSYSLRADVGGTAKYLIGTNGTTGVVIDGNNLGVTFGSSVIIPAGLTISGAGLAVTGTAAFVNGVTIGGTLGVTGAITGNVTGVLTVATGTAVAGTIFKTAANGTTIQGAAGSSNDFVLTNSTNGLVANVPTGTANIGFAGSVTAQGAVTGVHLNGGGGTPSAVVGAAAGTSPSAVTVSGNDSAGTLSLTNGSATTSGVLLTVTFASGYTGTPKVTLTYDLAGGGTFPVLIATNRSSTGFAVYVPSALAASAAYQIQYHVIG